ncbi:PREDICTED: probable serine/threonine-protein kinase At1g54610 [Lupinus angustifolius]|uniref:probable serine/threonine-protein kinase At1g54610 n=1 Tax=Lupinus angustifolius TaxID=3871 RepID=UPI00092FC95D|nr:PREDICTED: probable serine/threonine-protein kinase At1g54610 [Lupinus angustifolius]
MGCVTSKNLVVEDSREEDLRTKLTSRSKRETSEMSVSRLSSSIRVEGIRERDKLFDGVDMKASLLDKNGSGSVELYDDDGDRNGKKKMEKPELTALNHPGLGRILKASEGEQVAAGWPTWLSSAAGEAIEGWTPRSANTFERFFKIGQGTYSTVYKARDLTNQKIVALKRVRFDSLDPESVKFMAREILVLRRLDHPNVIKLEGLITSQTSRSLYLVFEYMEHDLTGLSSDPEIKFSEPQVKCYMQQLLSGLDHCHSRGVLHRDIKGSNLLIDNNGILKIADWGLATFFDSHHSVQMTSRVVTLWYRPPELLLGVSHYGVAVDLWSTGCILGELYSGRPILPGKTEVEQLHKIFKLCGSPSEDYWFKLRLRHSTAFRPPHHYRRCVAETFKECPSVAVKLIETLLSVEPVHRGTAATALKSEFFSSEPLACDPSTLPKYPPCKEIDSKLRDEATKRQEDAGGKERKVGSGVRQEKEPRAFVSSKDNTKSQIQFQQGQHLSSSKSRSGLLNPHREPGSGFLVFPHKQSEDVKERDIYFSRRTRKPSFSGPLVQGSDWEVGERPSVSNKVNLSKIPGSAASRTSLSRDQKEKPIPLWPPKTIQDGHGSRGRNIHASGPLLVSSNNMDEMLKERDRKFQEYSRRARIEKSKGEKFHAKQ